MTDIAAAPTRQTGPDNGETPPIEAQIAAGLAGFSRAAEELRSLPLGDVAPGLAFDAAWEPETETR